MDVYNNGEWVEAQLNFSLEWLKQEGLPCWLPVRKGEKKKKAQVFSVVPFNAINYDNTLSPARKFNNVSCELPSREWKRKEECDALWCLCKGLKLMFPMGAFPVERRPAFMTRSFAALTFDGRENRSQSWKRRLLQVGGCDDELAMGGRPI